jgi:predicted secreted protein
MGQLDLQLTIRSIISPSSTFTTSSFNITTKDASNNSIDVLVGSLVWSVDNANSLYNLVVSRDDYQNNDLTNFTIVL